MCTYWTPTLARHGFHLAPSISTHVTNSPDSDTENVSVFWVTIKITCFWVRDGIYGHLCVCVCARVSEIGSLATSLGIPVHLLVKANIFSANHRAGTQYRSIRPAEVHTEHQEKDDLSEAWFGMVFGARHAGLCISETVDFPAQPSLEFTKNRQ